jgi:hypothetical protein
MSDQSKKAVIKKRVLTPEQEAKLAEIRRIKVFSKPDSAKATARFIGDKSKLKN